jgi:predicted Zn-dependent protease
VIREPQNASLKADLIRADAEIDGVDAAVSKARESAASDPGNAIYDVVSAELYEKAGRGEEAVSLLESAAASRPTDNGLAPALARLYVRMSMPAKAEAFLKDRLKADRRIWRPARSWRSIMRRKITVPLLSPSTRV